MVTYICPSCNKIFDQKSHYTRHINRKTPCTELAQVIEVPNSKSCNFCKAEFKQLSSLNRHIRENRCKVKKDIDEDKERIFSQLVKQVNELKKDNDNLKSIINNNINNGTINHGTINNNNIKIVAFGKEDISHISDTEWLRILNRSYKSIEDLALITHFDNNRPENHNIYISNIRSKYIMVHDGKKWNVKDRKDTVDDLYDEKAYIIFNKVDELTRKLPIKIVDKFNKIKTGYDEDKIRKALIKDLDMALYNQRHIPIYTHKIAET